MPRLYRLFRITQIIKLFRRNKNSPVIMKIQEFLRLRSSTVRLWGILISVVVIAHISACIWFLMAKLDNFGPETWVYKGKYMNDYES